MSPASPTSDADLVPLTECDTPEQAALLRGLLEAGGLQALVESEHHQHLQLRWGALAPVRVLVRRGDLEEAQALLQAVPEEDAGGEAQGPAEDPERGPHAPDAFGLQGAEQGPGHGEGRGAAEAPDAPDAADDGRAKRRRRIAWSLLAFPVVGLLLQTGGLLYQRWQQGPRLAVQAQLEAGDRAYAQGAWTAAEAAYRAALPDAERLPADEGQVPAVHARLAAAHLEQGRFGEAEASARLALVGLERALGEDADGTEAAAVARHLLGRALAGRQQHAEAEQELRRAVSQLQGLHAARHAEAAWDLGQLLLERARARDAARVLQDALRAVELQVEAESVQPLLTLLLDAHAKAGQHAEAVRAGERALALEPFLEPDPEARRELVAGYARALRAVGREADARAAESDLVVPAHADVE